MSRTESSLQCDVRIVQLLLKHGADPNRPDPQIGALPLLTAFDVGDMNCARIIKDAGGRVDGREVGGRNILTAAVGAAARRHDMSFLDVAIGWGVDPNVRADDGATALHEAVGISSAEVAQALLDRGVDPCVRNELGQTPLDMAINLTRPDALLDALRRATRCRERGRTN